MNLFNLDEKIVRLLVLAIMSVSGIVFFEPAPYDLLMAFLILLSLPRIIKDIHAAKPTYLTLLFMIFALTNIISVINIFDYRIFLKYSGVTLYLMFSALWVKVYLQETKDSSSLFKGYLIASVIAVVVGQLPSLGMQIPGLTVDDGWRVRGTFKDPNVFAPFLIPPIFYLFDRIRAKEKAFREEFLVLLLHVGILFAFSRGAWIAYGVTALLYIAFHISRLNKATVLKGLRIVAATALIWVLLLNITGRYEFFLGRFGLMSYDDDRFATQLAATTGDDEYVKNVTRQVYVLEEQKVTDDTNSGNETSSTLTDSKIGDNDKDLNITSDQKDQTGFLIDLIGIGPGQFEIKYPLSAHSLYVRAVTENGYLGFFSLMGFLLLIMVRLFFDNEVHSEYSGLTKKTVLALIIGILVNGIVIDIIHWRHLWLLIGIAWALVDQSKTRQGADTNHKAGGAIEH